MKKSIFRSTAAATIAVAGLALCHHAHASKFTVTSSSLGSDARFIVTRDDTTAAETVNYRTVSLSAYAGQHYTAKSGTLTFPAGQSAVTNTVTETTPSSDAYKFQTGSSRSYRFELTDVGGFLVTNATRTLTTGTRVTASDAFGEKALSINAGTITVTDGGYDQAYHSANVNDYFSAAAPKDYLVAAGAQLRATVTFHAREKDDGYQYVAIYANTSTSNIDTGAKDGDPGTVSYSRYMAGFTIDGNVSSTWYPYTFPLTSKGHACGEQTHPWSGNSNGNLKQQYFKSNCRAADGRLIIPTDLSSLYVRLNASGNLNDTWYASNVVAHVQAVDTTAPTSLLGVSVPPGTYAKGNEVYVSVAFGEIMKVSGTPTLSTTWGSFAYAGGSGSNVLTFKGTISTSASNTLDVVKMQHGGNMQGKVQDLAGNEFSGSVSARNLATLAANHNYSITYNLSGGTLPSGTSNPATYTYETPSFTLATPTRPGYIFTGWTGSNGARPQTSITIEANSHGDCAYTANWRRIIPYIDADGNEQLCAEYGTLGSGQGNAEYDWDELYFFVVDDNVTFRGQNRFNRNGITKIIICDGASLAVSNANDTAMIANTLAFYGQTNGTGRLNLNSSVRGLSADTDIQINGVNVTANGGEYGIYATGSVTINGGNVNATGGTEGIYAGNVINLGWTRPTDSIVANSYGGRVIVKGGQVFTDGSNIYHGELSSAERDAIAGKTLRPAYSITLPEGVVASGVVTQIVNTAYAIADTTVTLSAATPGYGISNVTVDGVPLALVDGTYSFVASADGITVTAAVCIPVPYIDAGGTEQMCTSYTVLTNATGDVAYGERDAESWYVVTNNVTISGQLYFYDGTAHLILCDGATLAVTNANGAAIDACGLTIYGQTNGTGTVTATATGGLDRHGIFAGSVTINGGTVTASGGDSGIYAENGSVTINGGTVTANGGDSGIYAAYHGSVTINGGTVTANGGNYGIVAANSIYDDTPQGTIILGWTNPTDSITASSYGGFIYAKDDQRLTDGSAIYESSLGESPSAIAGKTLQPAYSITLPEGVVASGVVTQIVNTAYARPGDTVTLSAALGYYGIGTVTVDGVPLEPVGGTYSFTASDAVTIAATVTPITYAVRFDANGGDGSMPNQSFTYDTPQALSSNAFTRTGYTFAGWRGADGAIYPDRAEVINLTNAQDAVVSLTAQWLPHIPYIDEDGTERICTDYTVLTNAAGGVEYGRDNAENWYVVTNAVTIEGVLLLRNHSHLILCDGATLAVTNTNDTAIFTSGNITIYCQTNGTGRLDANGRHGIVTSLQGSVTINGGTVTAEGSIEGIYANSSVTINGGTVTANATATSGTGINVGGGDVTINGGTVTANGGYYGIYVGGGSVTINGGTVNVTGDNNIYVRGDVTINGGTVTAAGQNVIYSSIGSITVNGGNVNVEGDYSGIYAGSSVTIKDGSVTATGGNSGIYADKGSITINGGTVNATGNDYAGISADGSSVTINGGTVTANGIGNTSLGILARSSVTINGGNVAARGSIGILVNNGNITLGWTNSADSITASSYYANNGNVSIKSGQTLTDGSAIYKDIDDLGSSPSDLARKTLQPAYSITLPEGVVASGVVTQIDNTAYALPGTNVTLSAATPGYAIGNVTVNGNAIDPVGGIYTFAADAASITVTATVFVVSSVIEIGTGAEFAEYMASRLVSYSDITFAFTNDIDMSGVTYTRPSGDFNATLDGRGHTLTSLSLKKDMPNLIGTLKGTVRDLTIAGYSSPGNVGGTSLIAYSSSGGTLSGVVLTNCTWNLPNVTSGTAGFIYETQDNMTTITNCWLVDCRVIGYNATRGDQVIGGFVAKASQLRMVDCHVVFSNTNIISIGNNIPAAGAFIGQTAAGVTIERCSSNARVKIVSNVATQVGGAGGFVGVATMSGSPVIRDCANFGIVESTVPTYPAGGFIGEVGSESGDFSLTVQSCFNYGDVASPFAAGGLIGRYRGATSTLSNNGNSGAISSEAGFAGGLVGLVCYNGANRTWRILNAMQAGAVSTMSGCAGLLVGGVEESDLGGLTMSVSNAWIAGSATYSDGGQAGILFGGRDITAENELTIELHGSKVLESNGTLALYYDKGNAAVAWDSPVTFGADALSGSAVRNALNLYAREQNYTTWVRGRCFPELMTFGVECFSGFFIKFR